MSAIMDAIQRASAQQAGADGSAQQPCQCADCRAAHDEIDARYHRKTAAIFAENRHRVDAILAKYRLRS